jgi:hypothetical protein
MKGQDVVVLLGSGLAIWVLGTVYSGYRGAAMLETTSLRDWVAFAVSPLVSAALCVALLMLWRVPVRDLRGGSGDCRVGDAHEFLFG